MPVIPDHHVEALSLSADRKAKQHEQRPQGPWKMTESKREFRIIYIIGTGRNGSSLLDVVFGNGEKVQSTGELYRSLSAWKNNKTCSCGKEVENCEFWSRVRHSNDNTFDSLDRNDISRALRRFERGTLSLLRLELHKIARSRTFLKYERSLKELYTATSTVSAKPVLVDSSKHPFRGYALLNVFRGNVYFVQRLRLLPISAS